MSEWIAGKRVLITGASSGIGAELARAFATQGATVGLAARREAELAAVLADCAAHQPACRMWKVDLADLDGLDAFAARADDELGGIDLLVNNAGIPKRRTVADLTWAEVEAVNRINYLSPVRLTMAVLPRMLARGSGAILNVSSVAARLSPAGEAAYAATKAAITSFSEALAIELWDTGVSVHVLNPGVIDTPLFQLPGNDPLKAPVEPLPVSAVVDPVLRQLAEGTFEIYVPEWFGDVVRSKANDLPAYLAGSAAFFRSLTPPGT